MANNKTSGKISAQPRLHQRAPEIQAYGTVNHLLPLELEEPVRLEMTAQLNQLLADTMTLRDLYKKSHWQVAGPTFYQLHLLFDKHYDEQNELVDSIAERIQLLGGVSKLLAQLFAEFLQSRIIPKLAILTSAEGGAKRLRVVQLDHEHRGVRKHPLRGCRGLSPLYREPQKRDQPEASHQGPATYRDLRRTHQMKLRFRHPSLTGRGSCSYRRPTRRGPDLASGSEPDRAAGGDRRTFANSESNLYPPE